MEDRAEPTASLGPCPSARFGGRAGGRGGGGALRRDALTKRRHKVGRKGGRMSVNRKRTIAIRPVIDQKPRKITKIVGLNGKGFSVVTPYHKARSGFLYKMLMPLNIHKPGTHSDSVPAQGESRIAPESTGSGADRGCADWKWTLEALYWLGDQVFQSLGLPRVRRRQAATSDFGQLLLPELRSHGHARKGCGSLRVKGVEDRFPQGR